jgi:hypothetical protein
MSMLVDLQKISILALLMEVTGLSLSYMITVNHSMRLKCSELRDSSWKGWSARNSNVGVISGYSSHAFQADTLLFPKNAEVVSQPTKRGILVRTLSGPPRGHQKSNSH